MEFTDTFKHGYAFSEVMVKNILAQIDRIKSRKPSIILIDGGLGSGKTTLAVHIADFINNQYGLPPIDLDIKDHEQLAMGGEDLQTQIRICKKENKPVIIYDEAGDFKKAYTMSRFNKALGQLMDKIRTFNIIVIVCVPLFHRLDNSFFDNLSVRFLAHVERSSNESYSNFSVYDFECMAYIKYYISRYYSNAPHKAYKIITPNFRGHFLDLPKWRSDLLNRLSNKLKDRDAVVAEIKSRGLMSYRDLAVKCNRTVIWCRKKVAELKLKPTTIIKRAKYFDENALNRLIDAIG